MYLCLPAAHWHLPSNLCDVPILKCDAPNVPACMCSRRQQSKLSKRICLEQFWSFQYVLQWYVSAQNHMVPSPPYSPQCSALPLGSICRSLIKWVFLLSVPNYARLRLQSCCLQSIRRGQHLRSQWVMSCVLCTTLFVIAAPCRYQLSTVGGLPRLNWVCEHPVISSLAVGGTWLTTTTTHRTMVLDFRTMAENLPCTSECRLSPGPHNSKHDGRGFVRET